MLAPEQINEINHELHNLNPSSNRKRQLQKRLKEHHYATNYEPFTPSPYQVIFINYKTSTEKLQELIQQAQLALEIILDTESINIKFESNQPALIQVQLVFTNRPSVVIITELFHLPPENHEHFQLIKQLFEIILHPTKHVFIWGQSDELIPFTTSKIFNRTQLNKMKYCNLQNNYKKYRHQHHQHRSDNSTLDPCECERCLNHTQGYLWALQKATAIEINQYLSKVETTGKFNIGLDPELNMHKRKNDEHRAHLIEYAAHDVLSMEKIIDKMKMKNFHFEFQSATPEIEILFDSDSESDDDTMMIEQSYIFKSQSTSKTKLEQIKLTATAPETAQNQQPTPLHADEIQQQPSTITTTKIIELELTAEDSEFDTIEQQPTAAQHTSTATPTIRNIEPTSTTNEPTASQTPPTPATKSRQPNPLPEDQRKRIHNHSRTLSQRRRAYTYEFFIRNIATRYPVKPMKKKLRELGVDITQVNPLISNRTGERILRVGVKNPDQLVYYEDLTNGIFSQAQFRTFLRTTSNTSRHNHQTARQETQDQSRRIEHRNRKTQRSHF